MAMKVIFLVAVALVAPLASAVSYQEAFTEANILGDTISNRAMHYYLTNFDKSLTVTCFEKQLQNFKTFAKKMNTKLKYFAEDMGKDGEVKLIQEAGKFLEEMGETIKKLPENFWLLIENEQYEHALELRRDVGESVKENAEKFAKIIEELGKNQPDVAQRAHEKMEKIHAEAKKRSGAMSLAIKYCIEGTPSQ